MALRPLAARLPPAQPCSGLPLCPKRARNKRHVHERMGPKHALFTAEGALAGVRGGAGQVVGRLWGACGAPVGCARQGCRASPLEYGAHPPPCKRIYGACVVAIFANSGSLRRNSDICPYFFAAVGCMLMLVSRSPDLTSGTVRIFGGCPFFLPFAAFDAAPRLRPQRSLFSPWRRRPFRPAAQPAPALAPLFTPPSLQSPAPRRQLRSPSPW